MRAVPVLLAGLLMPLIPAYAQVTTNDGALDQLAPVTRPHRAPTRPAVKQPAPAPRPPVQAAASPKPVKPPIPVSPPAILALPPAVTVPLAHPPPVPVVPLADDAPGAASPIQNGVRVTFGRDRADMTAATAAALAKFADGLVGQSTTSITIFAYAAGNADDPSTPRRLSLQRALAARAVLMKAGIPSPRIYPRALGPAGGDEPDRVDVTTGSATPPATGHTG